jgi:DNA-binding protein HU-beta
MLFRILSEERKNTMTKTELINDMAKVLNSTKEAQTVLESLLSTISGTLKKGDSVTLTGFGTFKVSKLKARKGINPQTGEKIKIKAKNIVRFTPGKHLKEAIK